MDIDVSKLKEMIEDELNETIHLEIEKESNPTTIYFENKHFLISVLSNDNEFVIVKIESFKNNYGKKIVETIKEFCEDEEFDIIKARNVLDSGIRFWLEVGFEGTGENMYYEL